MVEEKKSIGGDLMSQKRNLILLLALFLVLSVIYIGLDKWNQAEEEKEAKKAEEEMIQVIVDADITWIQYTDGSNIMSYVLENDTWQFEIDTEIPMSQENVENIEKTISELTAVRELESPDALEDYGLTNPSYTLKYKSDGKENSILVGNMTGENYYLMVEETQKVYVCTSDLVNTLTFELADVVQNDQVPTIGSGNLLKVEIIEDGKTTVFEEEDELAQLAGGFGVLTLSDCVDYHVTDETLKTYGLNKKERMTATATYSSSDTEENKNFTVYIGKETEEENQYIMVEDSKMVYQVSKDIIGNMTVVSEEE